MNKTSQELCYEIVLKIRELCNYAVTVEEFEANEPRVGFYPDMFENSATVAAHGTHVHIGNPEDMSFATFIEQLHTFLCEYGEEVKNRPKQKQESKDEDQRRLDSGGITREQLRDENSAFKGIANNAKPLWNKGKLY
jgi:hypothetical protein